LSRDGTWGGATSQRDGYCACGETGEFQSIKFKAKRLNIVNVP